MSGHPPRRLKLAAAALGAVMAVMLAGGLAQAADKRPFDATFTIDKSVPAKWKNVGCALSYIAEQMAFAHPGLDPRSHRKDNPVRVSGKVSFHRDALVVQIGRRKARIDAPHHTALRKLLVRAIPGLTKADRRLALWREHLPLEGLRRLGEVCTAFKAAASAGYDRKLMPKLSEAMALTAAAPRSYVALVLSARVLSIGQDGIRPRVCSQLQRALLGNPNGFHAYQWMQLLAEKGQCGVVPRDVETMIRAGVGCAAALGATGEALGWSTSSSRGGPRMTVRSMVQSQPLDVVAPGGAVTEALACTKADLPALRRGLAKSRWRTPILLAMARIHRQEGRPEEAVKLLQAVKGPGAAEQLGWLAHTMGDHKRAVESFEQARVLYRKIREHSKVAGVLNALLQIHGVRGDYAQATVWFDKAQAHAKAFKLPLAEAVGLNTMGMLLSAMGQPDNALLHHKLAAKRLATVGDVLGELATEANIAAAFDLMGRPAEAIKRYRAVLGRVRRLNNRRLEGVVLSNLGSRLRRSGRVDEGAKLLAQALVIAIESHNRWSEGKIRHELGAGLLTQGKHKQALVQTLHALFIRRELGDRGGEGITLNNLAAVWARRNKLHLAVYYGKQALNTFEALRREVRAAGGTDKKYMRAREGTYRGLAGLLVDAGRFVEAERVLGLLKREEHAQYMRDAGSGDGSVALIRVESEWVEKEAALSAAFMKTAREFAAASKTARTSSELRRLRALNKKLQAGRDRVAAFLEELAANPAGGAAKARSLEDKATISGHLEALGKDVAAIYTLVDEDALRIMLVAHGETLAFKVPVKRVELRRDIQRLRTALKTAKYDPKPAARAVYAHLFPAGLEAAIAAAKVTRLMWSLDDALRYIPLAALHDGKGYLIERFHQTVVTSANNRAIATQPSKAWRALGLGVSKEHGQLAALPGVKEELKGIVRGAGKQGAKAVLAGTVLLDAKFTVASLKEALLVPGRYQVVHIASHFVLAPGDESHSYLLTGDGGSLTLTALKRMRSLFKGVELVTLSACNTATGDIGSGREVDGLAEEVQRKGAHAVIATLWPVADSSTPVLMTSFYRHRVAKPAEGKGAALRRAQLDLLHGRAKAKAEPSRGARPKNGNAPGPVFVRDPAKAFAHPHYWAPFILVGNFK